MDVDQFDFELPPERIAQQPARPRDSARLMVLAADAEAPADKGVRDLASMLRPGDIMVFNDTRVLPARLTGKRGDATRTGRPEGGAKIEVTLHRWLDQRTWRAFARPARKLKPRDYIVFAPGFGADVMEKLDGGEVVLRFTVMGPELRDMLEKYGRMPLPPYIKRGDAGEPQDRDDYQTMFAEKDGAVAAPTAALHFTPELMRSLEDRGVEQARLTLHVGAGTFLPVKAEDTRDHVMHAEWGRIDADTAERLNAARAAGGRIVACGTTAMRLLESAADEAGVIHPFMGETNIFITPGYKFRAVDVLLTNFHLPKSTLFMLVSAFAGLARMKAAYAHAIESEYRFYSYGDACLLERREDAA